VDYNEIAFKKSTTDNRVDTSRSYHTGRYFWGLTTTAVRFPSVYQHISYRNNDLLVFSKQGLEFALECDVFYLLDESELPAIFSEFGLAFNSRLYDAVKASIKNTAPEFEVNDYLNNRTEIADIFLSNLNTDLEVLHVTVRPYKFLLQYLDFPDNLKQKFLSTAVQETNNQKALLQQQVDLIQKETDQLVEAIQANITIIAQNGTSTADVLIKNAQSLANNILLSATGQGLSFLFDELEMTNSTDRKKLFELMTLLDSQTNPRVIVGDFGGNIIIGT
jgi:frataxin-like iron-binding protein CyaY